MFWKGRTQTDTARDEARGFASTTSGKPASAATLAVS
jgi:hypothetical protein